MQRASQPPSLRAGVPNKLELRPSPRRLTLAGNAARSAIPALWGPVVYRAKLESSPPSSSPQARKQEEPLQTSNPTQGEVEVKGKKEEEEQSTKQSENESTMPPKEETSEEISNSVSPNEKAEGEGAKETNAASNKTTETVNLGGEVWQVVERRKTGIRGLEEWVTVSQRQGDKGAPTVMEWIVQKKGQAEDREAEAEGKQEEEEDATVEEIVFEEEEEEAEQPKSLQRTESEYEFYQMLTGGVSHRLKELQQIETLEEELTLNTETGDATFTASPGTTSAAVSLSSTPTSTVHIRSPLKSSGRHPPKLANVVGETFGSGENCSEDEKEEASGGKRDREESFSRPKTMTIHTPLLPREMRIPLASTSSTTASESTSSATRSAIWQRSSAATGRSAHATVSSSSSAVSTRRSIPKKQTKTSYVKSASLRFTRRKLHNGSNSSSSSSSEKGGGSTILHRPIRRNKTRAKDDNDIHKNMLSPPTTSFTAKTPVLSGLHRVQSVRALEKEKGEAEKEEDSKNKTEKTNRKQSDRTEQSEENETEKEEEPKEAKEANQKLESRPPRIVIRGLGEEEEDEKDDDDEEEGRENSLKEYKELEDLHRKKEMERVLRLATRRNTQNNIVVQQTDFSVSLHISADDEEEDEEEEETHGEAGNNMQPNENVAL